MCVAIVFKSHYGRWRTAVDVTCGPLRWEVSVNGITSLGGDEGRVVCGCGDDTVRVYDMNDGSCLQTLRVAQRCCSLCCGDGWW